MLTTEQHKEFESNGILRMPGAISSVATEAMRRIVWECLRERHHIRHDLPDTWPEPAAKSLEMQQIGSDYRFIGTHHLRKSVTFEQVGNPFVCGVLDELLGTGNWQRPDRWGSLLVALPESRGPWDVPGSNWHLDFPASPSLTGLPGVRIFTCLEKLSERGGGTVFVAGSHRLVQNITRGRPDRLASAEVRKLLIRTYPWIRALCSKSDKADRVERFMSRATDLDGVQVRVAEMTGEPGDMFLAHPLILHAPAINCSSIPRVVLSASVFRVGIEPFKTYP